mmetsp:Transcript_15967/g.29218  ORF Transcript_15967/g.29218 Transcript_15967/m.29218 type:complete len:357 (+) Transcript_15967:49-1119(+)
MSMLPWRSKARDLRSLLLLTVAACLFGCSQRGCESFVGSHRSVLNRVVCSRGVFAETASPQRRLRHPLALRAAEDSDGVVRLQKEASKRPIRFTALGGSRGNFLLEIGGQKFLVNPRLDESSGLAPEKVHELVDYVVITSRVDGSMHMPTLARMNSRRTNFICSGPVGEQLAETGLFDNIATLQPGPGGRVLVEGEGDASDVLVLVAPGAVQAPWQPVESAFVFVDAATGLAIGYEAVGEYLGTGASSQVDGIPEEALQIDYLITPDLREAGEVLKGLVKLGELSVKGVVSLAEAEDEDQSILAPFLFIDRAIDKTLGASGETPEEFREFLRQQGSPLSDVELQEAVAGGAPIVLD